MQSLSRGRVCVCLCVFASPLFQNSAILCELWLYHEGSSSLWPLLPGHSGVKLPCLRRPSWPNHLFPVPTPAQGFCSVCSHALFTFVFQFNLFSSLSYLFYPSFLALFRRIFCYFLFCNSAGSRSLPLIFFVEFLLMLHISVRSYFPSDMLLHPYYMLPQCFVMRNFSFLIIHNL